MINVYSIDIPHEILCSVVFFFLLLQYFPNPQSLVRRLQLFDMFWEKKLVI